MSQVFADAHYWVAIINDQDQSRAAAKAVSHTLQGATIFTTKEALTGGALTNRRFSPRHPFQLRRLDRPTMLAVDDLATGFTLKPQGEFLRHAVPVSTDPPRRDDAAIAKLDLAAAKRPAVSLAAAEGY